MLVASVMGRAVRTALHPITLNCITLPFRLHFRFCTSAPIPTSQLSALLLQPHPRTLKQSCQMLQSILQKQNRSGLPVHLHPQVSQHLHSIITQLPTHIASAASNPESGLYSLLNLLCYANYQRVLKQLEHVQPVGHLYDTMQSEGVWGELLGGFGGVGLPARATILKYMDKYLRGNAQAMARVREEIEKVRELPTAASSKDIIHYMKSAVKYTVLVQGRQQLCMDGEFVSKCLDRVYSSLLLIDPKMLYYFTELLHELTTTTSTTIKNKMIRYQQLLTAVEEHIKGLALVQSKNVHDCVYLLRVMERIVGTEHGGRVRGSASKIYDYMKGVLRETLGHKQQQQKQAEGSTEAIHKPQQPEQQQTLQSLPQSPAQQSPDKQPAPFTQPNPIRLVDLNICLQSMLRLSLIDADLFALLQSLFFRVLPQSPTPHILFHLRHRLAITRTVIHNLRLSPTPSTEARVRSIKKQHVDFVGRLVEEVSRGGAVGFGELMEMVGVCQGLGVRSRALKRAIVGLRGKCEAQGKLTKQEMAYSEVILANF